MQKWLVGNAAEGLRPFCGSCHGVTHGSCLNGFENSRSAFHFPFRRKTDSFRLAPPTHEGRTANGTEKWNGARLLSFTSCRQDLQVNRKNLYPHESYSFLEALARLACNRPISASIPLNAACQASGDKMLRLSHRNHCT